MGASGMQGSSVINHVLAHPVLSTHFTIRALSRNPASLSDKPWYASVLDQQHADTDDPATLVTAFTDAHTVFAVTNYWEHLNLERDIQQGRNIADAARAAGVTHLIWSAQYSAAQVKGDPNDPIRIGTLDGKCAVMEYIEATKAQRTPALRATHPIAAFYMQNLPKFMVWPLSAGDEEANRAASATSLPASDDRDIYVWRHPWDYEHTQVPLLDVNGDMGLFVAGILLRELGAPGSMDGAKVHCVSAWTTPRAMVEGFARVMNSTPPAAVANGNDILAKENADQPPRQAAEPTTTKQKHLLFIDVETEEAYRPLLPDFLREGLPPCMARYRDYPLYGRTGKSVQPEHDRVLEGVGRGPTSWEAYVRRDWEVDWHG